MKQNKQRVATVDWHLLGSKEAKTDEQEIRKRWRLRGKSHHQQSNPKA
jgi:hypothetical protein